MTESRQDFIAQGEHARLVREHREREIRREEQERTAQRLAGLAVAEDGSAPRVLGRRFARAGSFGIELVLVDHLPPETPMRVLITQARPIDGATMLSTLRSLGTAILEGGAIQEPGHRFWSGPLIDPFGGGTLTPHSSLPAIGEPLYRSAPPETASPSDEERASAIEAAREAVTVLAPTKARARDLAATLRAALEAGPHAVLTLADELDRHGRPAGDSTDPAPPRAA